MIHVHATVILLDVYQFVTWPSPTFYITLPCKINRIRHAWVGHGVYYYISHWITYHVYTCICHMCMYAYISYEYSRQVCQYVHVEYEEHVSSIVNLYSLTHGNKVWAEQTTQTADTCFQLVGLHQRCVCLAALQQPRLTYPRHLYYLQYRANLN